LVSHTAVYTMEVVDVESIARGRTDCGVRPDGSFG